MAGSTRRPPPPERQVARMFDLVVGRYDLLNRLLSLGLDGRWRRATARAAHVRRGQRVLDLGCGSGDLGLALVGRARVVGIDVSRGMLDAAAGKAAGRMRFVMGSAFHLPFRQAAFDAVVSAFVLRNLDDLPGVFAELARVTAPGGRVALVEITEPGNPWIRRGFDAYFRTVPPLLGSLAGSPDAYRYLARSVAQIPAAAELCALLAAAGFERCEGRTMTGGIVTLFTAIRPAGEGDRPDRRVVSPLRS